MSSSRFKFAKKPEEGRGRTPPRVNMMKPGDTKGRPSVTESATAGRLSPEALADKMGSRFLSHLDHRMAAALEEGVASALPSDVHRSTIRTEVTVHRERASPEPDAGGWLERGDTPTERRPSKHSMASSSAHSGFGADPPVVPDFAGMSPVSPGFGKRGSLVDTDTAALLRRAVEAGGDSPVEASPKAVPKRKSAAGRGRGKSTIPDLPDLARGASGTNRGLPVVPAASSTPRKRGTKS